MIRADAKTVHVVLYEGKGSDPLPTEERVDVMSALLEGGYAVTRASGVGVAGPASSDVTVVIGRLAEPPPVAANGNTVLFHELTGLDGESALSLVKASESAEGVEPRRDWKPWFPVIDYDRCTNCMQCLSFCLFDVYGVDAQEQITVQNQTKCKTDCPACSRVCPEVAILFPKYGKGPINGDVVRQEDLQREAMKVDVSSLLGGDIYAALRERQTDARKRFSTERDESKALLERKRCLKQLKNDLDIPDEVLMSLPSAGDIQERAERARKKNELRMARSQTVKDQTKAPTQEEWGI